MRHGSELAQLMAALSRGTARHDLQQTGRQQQMWMRAVLNHIGRCDVNGHPTSLLRTTAESTSDLPCRMASTYRRELLARF